MEAFSNGMGEEKKRGQTLSHQRGEDTQDKKADGLDIKAKELSQTHRAIRCGLLSFSLASFQQISTRLAAKQESSWPLPTSECIFLTKVPKEN